MDRCIDGCINIGVNVALLSLLLVTTDPQKSVKLTLQKANIYTS